MVLFIANLIYLWLHTCCQIPEENHEAAINTVDVHYYEMSEKTFHMVHRIPSKVPCVVLKP